MSKLSIYTNNWLDIVFEGKNKEYGAFQLRRKSDETTLLAFCLGVSSIAMLATIPLLIGSFAPNHDIVIPDPVFELTNVHLANVKPNKPQIPIKAALPIAKKKTDDVKKELINPEIVKHEEADPNITKHDEHLSKENPETDNKGTTSTSNVPVNTSAGTEKNIPNTKTDESINTTVMLDKLPEFPGGINAFYSYVGENFEKIEVEETISVIVSFVIEKDGSMTDVKILRSSTPSIDREAIRILKALRTKWKPGFKNGQAVRTEYKLPIKVKK